MLQKYLSSTEKLALKEFKAQILQKLKGEILALKIFGSKAQGDFKKTSDIDILVLLKKSSFSKKDLIFDIATEILLKYGVDLSIKIFSEKEFQYLNKLQTPFMLNIQKEAKAI